MQRLTENKIVLITRKTRLDELIARFNSVMQAKFYIEHLGSDFHDYQLEHETYYAAVNSVVQQLAVCGRVQHVDRLFLPNFVFGPGDVVVVIGQDGLVANTLKYLHGQPLLGINPDPARWDGVLLPFTVGDIRHIVSEVFNKKRPVKNVTMGKVVLNDGQTLLAVNDFYIGQKTHVSSRYILSMGDRSERHSSSGIIVSTGLGSSGWLKSVVAGATGIAGTLQKPIKKRNEKLSASSDDPVQQPAFVEMQWDSDFLYYSVREPFPSKSSQATMVFGKVENQNPLTITSLMGENGVIFSDGLEHDFLSFNSGIEATITIAEYKGCLVV